MRKFGQFLFTLIPVLLALAIQIGVVFFFYGISFMLEFGWYAGNSSVTFSEIMTDLFNWESLRDSAYLMVPYAAFCIALFGLWYYIKYDGNYFVSLRTDFHPLLLVGILMLVPGMQYLSTYIVNFTAILFPDWLRAYEELIESAGLDGTVTFLMFCYSVLLAPVCEELIFRGVTLRQAKKCLPFWAANLWQAFLFGAFHMNMMQGIYAFSLALILGYVCEKSNSIYNPILLHMLFNFWGTVLYRFFTIGDSSFSIIFWFIFGLAMTVGGLAVFRKGCQSVSQKTD